MDDDDGDERNRNGFMGYDGGLIEKEAKRVRERLVDESLACRYLAAQCLVSASNQGRQLGR